MLKLLAALGLAFALSAFPAMAQTDADTDAAIDGVLMDHVPFRAAFDAIQKAVADGDKAAFASWVSYPIDLTVAGKPMTIKDAKHFEEHYDAIMTEEIRNAITSQTWSTLFANYQGVMFGDGELWLSGICKDDKCAKFDVKIITIQSTDNLKAN